MRRGNLTDVKHLADQQTKLIKLTVQAVLISLQNMEHAGPGSPVVA